MQFLSRVILRKKLNKVIAYLLVFQGLFHKHLLIDNIINDLNCRLNTLLADFTHCSSSTLSALFKTYSMNMVVRFGHVIRIVQANFTLSWGKAIRRLWKIPYRTHNKFIYNINKCMPIDTTLEKRYIKYLCNLNLINSNCNLYIIKLSLNNVSRRNSSVMRLSLKNYVNRESRDSCSDLIFSRKESFH